MTTGFWAVVIHLAGLTIVVLPWVGVETVVGSSVASALGLGIIAVLWVKTWHNYTRRTV